MNIGEVTSLMRSNSQLASSCVVAGQFISTPRYFNQLTPTPLILDQTSVVASIYNEWDLTIKIYPVLV